MRRGLAGILAVALIGGCTVGPATTVIPSRAPSAEPSPTIAPPTESPSPGSGGDAAFAFATASGNLDALASYQFTVDLETTSAGGTSGTGMSGMVINRPAKAYSLVLTTVTGTATTSSSALAIGDRFWIKEGDGAWQEQPASYAVAYLSAYAGFRPETIFGVTFGGLGAQFGAVGDEDKNGVPSTHYRGSSDSLNTLFAGISGVAATYESDVWLARHGGFLVSSEVRSTGAIASASGEYSSVVNITNVNDPANTLTPPS